MERKHYLDNIRWITVVLVVIYHVIYIFNSEGVLSNFGVQGIRGLDDFLYVVYPWFMVLLFVVAGASARISLSKRSGKKFAADRAKRLLVPSIFVTFTFGWFCGWVTDYYADMFAGAGDQIPGVVKYIIYSLSGIGPMWFAHELFLASMVLLLIRVMDKKDRITEKCRQIKWWGWAIVFLSFFVSANILNTPLIEVYRNGIYVFSFLMGYYIFSQEEILDKLSRIKVPLVILSVVAAVAYTCYIHFVIAPMSTSDILTSVNYCSLVVLKNIWTNLYAFIVILAVFACARDWLNFENSLSAYMTGANFGFYALHYPVLCVVAFFTLEILNLPMWACYLTNLAGTFMIVPILYEIIRRIPVVRFLILGISKRR